MNTKKKEHALPNILFNIVIPVVILINLSKKFGENGPTYALIAALFFPVAYGLWDYFQNKNKNIISIFGILNILLTGGLALFQFEGFWFAVKEAAFPLIIGLVVYYSTFTKKPAMEWLIYNENLMNVSLIKQHLEERNNVDQFFKHLKKSTVYLSLSFYLSAILNFILATYIFIDISKALTQTEQSAILNEQIADMQWMGYFVIALPLTVFTGFILFHLVGGIKKYTELATEDIFPAMKVTPKDQAEN
jgi:hypothetical protein